MRTEIFKSQAEECRRQATTTFEGRPEKAFLLRLAGVFDELGHKSARARESGPQS
jgi:hypothetical protein